MNDVGMGQKEKKQLEAESKAWEKYFFNTKGDCLLSFINKKTF